MKKLFFVTLVLALFVFIPLHFSLASMAPGAPSVGSTSGVGGGTAITPLQVNLQINGSHNPIVVPWSGNTSVAFQISWTSNDSNATCTLVNAFFPDGFNLASSGQQTSGALEPSQADSSGFNGYTITCTDNGQTSTDTVPISFASAPAQVPQANLTVNGQAGTVTVPYNSQATIQWTSSYLAHCILSTNGSLKANLETSEEFDSTPLTTNQIYILQCYNTYGTFFGNTVTVNVQPQEQTTTPPVVPTPVLNQTSTPAPTPTQTSTSASTSTVNSVSAPTTIPSTTPTCDSTAKAIVTAAGGCSNISPTSYANIYTACCQITQATLLQMLNTDLANGSLTTTETTSLLSALNTYLSQ